MTALQPRKAVRAGDVDPVTGSRVAPQATVGDYLSLVKPRIIELLLVTTFPVMFLAQRGVPSAGLVLATLVGGTLSAASANTFNCYVDRDIDRLMHRTTNRPLVTGAISERAALIFGTTLGVLSVVVLGFFVNWLSAALSFLAIVLYVWLYTIVLKRRTAQNIVWGGVAGCIPVLIGWTAVTNRLDWAPFVLFLVVFFWTPPHYWPLSMRFKEDYAAAGIPMLPVVETNANVARQIVAYSWATVATSLVLIPVADMGWIYSIVAVVTGVVFVVEAQRLAGRAHRDAHASLTSLRPMRLFHYSISYLTLLFVGVAIDPLVHLPLPF